ncbi:Oxysterol-binding protein 3 [Coemansia sp. RSA 989]|nr:Oxysterol-binding protein-domain-containing protein [Coemansia mojavensis]KAJ1743421.1 Oxysterol-binding protein 3 [Coemansia sp. RSA 1086]KAJ1751968.1 Oxysterol-binding protein 3 [Coemansia sp. RSA 1821]KAJ1866837.1 Oxysterol-binding protein 3 [Coemansia sp. RSA 989]KAJ1874100.1 Oxysterol-binding protein 3 [Coemansia sp. RSA 990]KAJ2671226.1 Oxysterol-binding protein 3 [Coemansia sp. RSA 1085]
MEEVEILPRDAYLHTVTVKHAPCTIQWWFSTKRKNIDFGLFQRHAPSSGDEASLSGSIGPVASRGSTIGTINGRRLASPPKALNTPQLQQLEESQRQALSAATKQRGGYFKLQDRNVVELMPLKHYESSKTTIKGSWNAVEPGTYVLYFDNSFSKNTSKRVSFCVAVKEIRQSVRPPVAMSGWLLKKKRKRMQGWAQRWISLQGHWLVYSTTEGGISRAKVDVANAVVSTSRQDHTITVDGDEGFLQLRAQNDADYNAWVAALKRTKEHAVVSAATDHGATFSAGAVPQSPMGPPRSEHSPAQQAHLGYESAVTRLTELIRDNVDDQQLRKAIYEHLQQMSEYAGTLFDMACTPTRPEISRAETNASGRPSLALTDTQASDVFYDTNEVLELARDESDISPDKSPAIGETEYDSDENEDDFEDTQDSGRMRRDLIRDPDFIEALAQNSLQQAEKKQVDEPASDADYEHDPQATMDHVQRQLVSYEPRTQLPAEACLANVGLVSILRKNMGKDLGSIAMPLVMNEPINALQALCEELAYCTLLQKADALEDSMDRLMYVAAFAMSTLSIKKHRAERKPFNPLLGETYELVEPQSKFRFVSEKVSHHPAVMACHADAPGFRMWQDSSGKSKFWGKSIELSQTSNVHIELPTHSDHFTYCKPSALIRGLISGVRTVDFTGEMTIVNSATGDRCSVTFKEPGMFSSSNDAVECRLYRGNSQSVDRVLRGSWSSQLEYERSPGHTEALWTVAALPPNAHNFYNFGYFTMRLNELVPETSQDLPPTDTRFRPDQRAYEEGRVDDAEYIKNELEEAQRARKRDRDAQGVTWTPQWFEESDDADSPTGRAWTYKGGYWDARAHHAFPPTVDLFKY